MSSARDSEHVDDVTRDAVDADTFEEGEGSEPVREAVMAYKTPDGFYDSEGLEGPPVYRGLALPEDSLVRGGATAMDQHHAGQHGFDDPAGMQAIDNLKLGASAFSSFDTQSPPMFDLLDVSVLPALPPMPKGEPVVLKDDGASPTIPCITKCPIKSYTTFKVKRDTVQPKAVTDKVKQVLDTAGIDCKVLREGLKLRGSICPKSDEGTESTTGYEAAGSVSFVFQLFYSEDNAHLVGVFRRLCGDVIAFNDRYRQFMDALRADQDLGFNIV